MQTTTDRPTRDTHDLLDLGAVLLDRAGVPAMERHFAEHLGGRRGPEALR